MWRDVLLAQPVRGDERVALGEAVEFLHATLADGERPASDVLREATNLGIAESTLRRARKAPGVQVRREGFGKDGGLLLALPPNGADAAAGAKQSNRVGNGNGLDHEAGLTVPP